VAREKRHYKRCKIDLASQLQSRDVKEIYVDDFKAISTVIIITVNSLVVKNNVG